MAFRNSVCKFLGILVLTAVCAVWADSAAEAKVSITIKNNRSHSLSFAFRWAGFDMPDDTVKGWYNVPAGATKTFTFSDAVYALTSDSFGYYATGGKKVWKGDLKGWVSSSGKAFSGNPDEPPSDAKSVGFRKITLKAGSSREDGSATLTFNP